MTFGETTVAAEVSKGVDLTGKVAVITGASGGIGLETARALASTGATVVLGNRDSSKAAAAAKDLQATVPGASVELGDLDLASLASVRAFTRWVSSNHDRIDVLINNAGVMATPQGQTAEGFELQFGTNHLGHFLLTNLLMPLLVAAAPSRVVNVSSNAHHRSGVNLDDPNYRQRDYAPWEAYGQSKTANILFTLELERRTGPRGVHAFAVHPGVVGTDLDRHLNEDERAWMETAIRDKGGMYRKTPAEGASTQVFAAIAPELAEQGGSYLEDCHVSNALAPHARDAEAATQLWSLSEELVGETFPA